MTDGTSSLAVAALVCGVLAVTALPIIAGIPAAGLGAAALVSLRQRPGLRGRGMALAGVGLGMVGGVVPLAVLLAIVARNHQFAEPVAVLVVGYGVATLVAAGWGLAGTGPGRGRSAAVTAGAAAGGLVGVAVACLAIVGLGFLFWYAAQQLFVAVFHSIGRAFTGSHTSSR